MSERDLVERQADEIIRLRASHARLLEALSAILEDPEAGTNIILIARNAMSGDWCGGHHPYGSSTPAAAGGGDE